MTNSRESCYLKRPLDGFDDMIGSLDVWIEEVLEWYPKEFGVKWVRPSPSTEWKGLQSVEGLFYKFHPSKLFNV